MTTDDHAASQNHRGTFELVEVSVQNAELHTDTCSDLEVNIYLASACFRATPTHSFSVNFQTRVVPLTLTTPLSVSTLNCSDSLLLKVLIMLGYPDEPNQAR